MIALIIVFLMGSAFLLGVGLGMECEEINQRDEAISAGVGEYYLDKNHKRQFRWKKGNKE